VLHTQLKFFYRPIRVRFPLRFPPSNFDAVPRIKLRWFSLCPNPQRPYSLPKPTSARLAEGLVRQLGRTLEGEQTAPRKRGCGLSNRATCNESFIETETASGDLLIFCQSEERVDGIAYETGRSPSVAEFKGAGPRRCFTRPSEARWDSPSGSERD
jgi:hypothetical protein